MLMIQPVFITEAAVWTKEVLGIEFMWLMKKEKFKMWSLAKREEVDEDVLYTLIRLTIQVL